MAAKKKPAAKSTANGGAVQTRCEQGPQDLLPVFVQAGASDVIDLTLTLCKSPFRVMVVVDQTTLVDQPMTDGATIKISPLPVGKHIVHWAFFAGAATWQVKSELVVGNVVRFRQRKSDASINPYNHTFVMLEVV